MPISNRTDLKALKSRVDLVALLIAHGFKIARMEFRKTYDFKTRCPFHRAAPKDKSTPVFIERSKGRYRCHQCGAEGDQLTFLQEYRHLSPEEVIDELRYWAGDEGQARLAATADRQPKEPRRGLR